MESKLLLTTSNRSEASLGYCTLDGDTSGGVAPIGGLDKNYVREFLCWTEKTGPDGIGNLPVMGLVNRQQPTAELRPSSSNQTDETDLMPYWLINKIEKMAIKNRYTPVEIYQSLKVSVEYDNNKLIKDITKFFNLMSMNQWKRERLAISFHMDDYNLDPKTWCRSPILSGGYVEELEELKQFLK
jgi:NAD+ synthase (glutamine-hydrolysing)